MKRTRIRPKPRRSIDTDETLAVRETYKAEHHECELSPLLRRLGQIHRIDDSGLECHHICSGNFGRLDLVSNLIMLSPTMHRWVHEVPSRGMTCCLYVKMKKAEINAEEFKRCSGQFIAGWVSNHRPDEEWMIPIWEELLAFLESLEGVCNLVPQPQVMLPTEVYPIFDILPRLWSAGYKTVEQDGEWHLFRKDGEGIVCGKTFRDLCVNIVLSGI